MDEKDFKDHAIQLHDIQKPQREKYHANYWISPTVTFWSTFSSYKYVQEKSGFLESAQDRQVFKIKMDESEY